MVNKPMTNEAKVYSGGNGSLYNQWCWKKLHLQIKEGYWNIFSHQTQKLAQSGHRYQHKRIKFCDLGFLAETPIAAQSRNRKTELDQN